MNTNELFVTATRRKLRFATTRGDLTIEDLWDLSLKDLDRIAVVTAKAIEPSAVSFLENPDPKKDRITEENTLRLEILKEVIRVRQDENKSALEASKKATQKRFLTELLEKKKMDALEGLSLEDIEKQLAELG